MPGQQCSLRGTTAAETKPLWMDWWIILKAEVWDWDESNPVDMKCSCVTVQQFSTSDQLWDFSQAGSIKFAETLSKWAYTRMMSEAAGLCCYLLLCLSRTRANRFTQVTSRRRAHRQGERGRLRRCDELLSAGDCVWLRSPWCVCVHACVCVCLCTYDLFISYLLYELVPK